MNALTWLALAVLGPGAVAVFVWFLRDVRRILSDGGADESAVRQIVDREQ